MIKKRVATLIFALCILISIISLVNSVVLTSSSNGDLAKRNLIISRVNQEPDPVEPGQYVKVRFRIENLGSEKTGQLVVGLKPHYPFTVLAGYDIEQNIGSLGARQKGDDAKIIEWRLLVDKNAPEGLNNLTLYYKDLNDKNTVAVYEDYFSIDVRTSDNILEVLSVTPSSITPGEESVLNITIKNLAESFVKDVTVNLMLNGLDIATVGGTTQFIIPMMKGKEEKVVSFRILPSSSAGLSVMKIPLVLSFKDTLNNRYTENTSFGIKLKADVDYLISVEQSSIKTSDATGEVTLKISNYGIANIKLMTVELKSSPHYEILSSPVIYVGKVDSDDFETLSYNIHVKKLNDLNDAKLRLVLKYKDDYNIEHTDEKEAQLMLFSSKDAVNYGLIQKQSVAGSLIVLLIILAAIGYFVYKRRKKKQVKS